MQDTYSLLREFADSWALLALTLIFLGVIGWAFRPGSRPLHDDAAMTPFRNDAATVPVARAPAGSAAPRIAGCANACPDCTCAKTLEALK
ncbi:cbb3-type cytochrome c oxidase subunit 3 [Palleronia pelagia]|uniref:Cytochrome c oxidase cbb3-type subunit 4 n=1 Tax=Palleronia pelagia TaxID=387096 RepID=A0A1H8KPB7_9RHOB|nr:cbb3-type cytochrome c oxidase subunit 3 [Palleronia pelagia]SEN94238.1 cytochrome c oxidase cbb3-type subunit 4 [Palleronia pelagia]